MPFGMIQWSPDTTGRGYRYNFGGASGQIRGFSLTHISGAGCPIYQDVPFTPTTARIHGSPARPGVPALDRRYLSSFSHSNERASPGLYQVRLDPGQPDSVNVQLTSSTRSGYGRFTYPRSRTSSMLINAGGSTKADGLASVHINPGRREVSGSASSGYFCMQRPRYRVYFDARFSRRFRAYGSWKRHSLKPGSVASTDTIRLNPRKAGHRARAGAYVTFDTRRDPLVKVRVAVSFVSVANARHNLRAEIGGQSFGGIRSRARRAWNRVLATVRARGGSTADLRTFYSDLYHAMVAPRTFNDVNGQYIGMDGRVHSAGQRTQYADFSGWDIYRSQIQLLAMLEPGRASDIVRSLLDDARQSGCLPRWSLANGQTMEMIGDPADPIIASAAAFGASQFDTAYALQAMLRGATQRCQSPNNYSYVERQGLSAYQSLGYIPYELNHQGRANDIFGSPDAVKGSAATSLEDMTADFSIAQFAARARNDGAVYGSFMNRSANWTKLFDSATGYIEPALANESFPPHFHPTTKLGFAEGDAAQYTWLVPQDIAGLAQKLGGTTAAVKRLDRFLSNLNDVRRFVHSLHAVLGNEVSLGTPWIYDWLRRPFKTQGTVRRAIRSLYGPGPGGYPGDDDLGELSSWYVFGALGLYPEVPGVGLLAIGSPLFRHTTLHLQHGTVVLDAAGAAPRRPYIHRLSVRGSPYQKPWISYCSLARGGRLKYRLAGRPSPAWGSGPDAVPPSFPATTTFPSTPCAF
jgi:predicted alpha-1,2-mannosidase